MYLIQYKLIYFVLWFLQLRFVKGEEKQYPYAKSGCPVSDFHKLVCPSKAQLKRPPLAKSSFKNAGGPTSFSSNSYRLWG